MTLALLPATVALAAGLGSVTLLFAARPLEALALHGICAFFGFFAARWQKADAVPAGAFEATLALCVPCVGGAVAWLYAAAPGVVGTADVADEFTHYIDASERMGRDDLVKEEAGFDPTPRKLAPMVDILRSNAPVAEKRVAIEALARLETPESVSILRDALSEPSVEVRFYAASVLSRLEERLASRLRSLEEDIASRRRTDPAVELEIARSYLDYAYYGLAEGVRRTTYLQRGLKHALVALGQNAGVEGLLVVGRCYLELGHFDEAEESFTEYLEEYGDDLKGLLWRAEARFYQGKYLGVRDDCRAAAGVGQAPERMRPVVEMWI